MPTASDLPIDTDASALDMAQVMFGTGITIIGASYSGAASASGVYSDGDATAPGVTPSDSGVILSTGQAEGITNASGDANLSSGISTNHGLDGDDDLSSVSGQTTYDAAIFEAEFVPDGNTLTMQVVFASEEYLEYVNSGFNDAVGVWVNGVQAELTVGSGGITTDNINDESNNNLYIDNPANAETYNTEMDGFTVALTLKAPVKAGEVNSIKIGIADGGDGAFDSNLLIAGQSVQTALVAGDDMFEVIAGQSIEADLLDNDVSAAGGSLTITAINGQPVSVGDTLTLPTGKVLELTDTGMVLAEATGSLGTNVFSYTVEDEAGNSDVGFVTLETVAPCFTEGVMIDTPSGPVAVETLQPGDAVMTRDHGAQILRWIGRSPRRAAGRDAPVRFAAGALGAHAAQDLSPNHRVLLVSAMAELFFGSSDVLVKAGDLVNGTSITRRADGGAVVYIHLMFDRHELLRGNGLWSESYHPGPQGCAGFDPETRAELRRLFPDLFATGQGGIGATARPVLRRHEARLLGTARA